MAAPRPAAALAPTVTDDRLAFKRALITPEGVDLRLTLASAGERATAFLLDMLIQLGVLLALTIAAGLLFAGLRQDGREVIAVIWLVGAFLIRNGYFVLFELSSRAATPGKRVLGLRVVARDGGRLTAETIFARNALREIEVFLPLTLLAAQAVAGDPVDGVVALLGVIWSGIFMLFPLFNRDRMRVGDMVAGTWVVRSPKAPLLADLSQGAAETLPRFAFSVQQTDAYGVKELEILEDVLRRRDGPTMRIVADRIRNKISFPQPAGETDAAFLAAYYAALRGRLEHRLLFGRRRRDKFDTA
jgi:uncharacterized RDD family membrane protein YckC